MHSKDLSQLIKEDRRSIFPQFFTDQPIDRSVLETLFDHANWAPNHARTEPWRFIVYRGGGKQRLADECAAAYRNNVAAEKQDEKKVDKMSEKILGSDTVVGIVMHRDEKERIPEWEEIAAVAMAVQNIWLSLESLGIGGYWSSPGWLTRDPRPLAKMEDRERCLGLFFLGHHAAPALERSRGDWQDKVRWEE